MAANKRILVQDMATRVTSLLGGTKTFNLKRISSLDWVFMIRKGLPSLTLDSFGQKIHATNAELAQMLGVSVRTLAWRRRKGILTSNESERLYRVARVIARAEDVFDHRANGLTWLKSPNISLGGVTPISMLDTEIGAELVMDTLGRIEHGIVA